MKTKIILPVTVTLLLGGLAIMIMGMGKVPVAYQNPVGSIWDCEKRCGAKRQDGIAFTTLGTGSATWTANSAPDASRPWSELQISNFTATGNNPELGDITFSADDSRLLTSRIESNVSGAAFPATSTLKIHAIANIGGVEYRSINPIEVQATLNAWPHNNDTYRQNGTTDFERTDTPGEVAFTLSEIETTMSAAP